MEPFREKQNKTKIFVNNCLIKIRMIFHTYYSCDYLPHTTFVSIFLNLTFNVSISNVNIKYPIGKSIFAVNLPVQLFPATVANADIRSLKSLHTLCDKYLDHMLVEFEQNFTVQHIRNFEFFDKKPFFKTIFDKVLTPFWKTFLLLKQLFDAKVLISRLLSFSVPKITVVRHM